MGKIYILVNVSMPGLVKIGHTHREAEERAMELSSSTGVPTSFEIFKTFEVADPEKVERIIHSRLSDYRVNGSREFFRIDAEDASRIIEEELPEQKLLDGADGDLEEHYDREDEWLRQATELTKVESEIWPGKIAGALKVSHQNACDIFATLQKRGFIDKDGRCQLYLRAVWRRGEADRLQRQKGLTRQQWIDEEKPSRPFTAKEALAYVIVFVGLGVAVEAYSNVGTDDFIVVGSMIAAFGLVLILKFRRG